MKIPAKVEYGVLALLTLASSCPSGERLQVKRIADDHAIPQRFLVQILLELKRAGIVASIRGAGGGYRLMRAPQDITLGEVVAALEGSPSGEGIDENQAPLERALAEAWLAAANAQQAFLDGITLADLVEQAANRRDPMWYI